MKEKIKKYDNLILSIILALTSIIIAFSIETYATDELWNFQNVYKMVNGYTIYKDANVIITPIFFIIGKFILQIFGANIFIFRIYNIIIYASLILVIYSIFKALKLEKREAFMYTIITHYFFYKLIECGANYNILALVFVLIGIYISLKYLKQEKFNIINGILIYLIIFTKQNIGAYYLIGTIVLQFILKGINIKTIKDLLKQGMITLILTLTHLGIFYINGNLADFINYCILGIREFANSNMAIETVGIIYFVLMFVTITFSIIQIRILKKQNQSEKIENIITLLTLGTPMLCVILPIINEYHIYMAMIIYEMLLIYMLHISIIKDFINTKIENIIKIAIIILISITTIRFGTINLKAINLDTNYNNPYFGAVMVEETKNKIEELNKYIENNNDKVIIFSQDAALYNIPKKRSNGAMDLPFLGNLGYNGEDNMVEKLSNMTGYKILIKKERFWQESEKIIEYIKNNFAKQEDIEDFQVYLVK